MVIGVQLFAQLKYHGGWVLGYASNITAAEVVEQTNQQRAKQNLPPLTVNDQLNQAALSKGQDMLQQQYWSHFAPDGKQPWDFIKSSGYVYLTAGENLARDFSNTPDMVAAWMNSQTHRENILSPKFQEIGVAVIDGSLQGEETTLVVQMFGTQQVALPAISEEGSELAEARAAIEGLLRQQAAANFAELSSVEAPTSEFAPLTTDQGLPVTEVTLRVPDLSKAPIISPLQLTKALFLAMVIIILVTLLYDTVVVTHRSTMRFVGKNAAHIMFLLVIAYLLIFFKGGLIN